MRLAFSAATSGEAGRLSRPIASGCGAGGNASKKSGTDGHRREIWASFTNALRIRSASRRSSHSLPASKASSQALEVPPSTSAAGVRSSDRQDSFCSPVRISISSHSLLQLTFPLL